MTASNHMLVGGSIALAVKQPWLAIPLALLSHFVLDALPHFGYNRANYAVSFKHKMAYIAILLDIIGLITLVIVFRSSTGLAWLCALIAFMPDFVWPLRYIFIERKPGAHPISPLTQFHRSIQWCERPWGIYVEIVFFATLLLVAKHNLLV